MSADFWWLLQKIDDQDYECLASQFELTNNCLEAFINNDREYNNWVRCNNDLVKIRGLVSNCNGLPFAEVFARVFLNESLLQCWKKLSICCEPSKDRVLEFTIYPGRSPLSILTLGFGPRLTLRLPGILGNFVLSNTQLVAWCDKNYEHMYKYVISKQYLDVLDAYFESELCSDTEMYADRVESIFVNLLKSLKVAGDEGKGLVSLSVPAQ